MPRYYRRRYTRVVRPKKKWASNIRKIFYDSGTTALGASRFGFAELLSGNSVENTIGGSGIATVPTPTVVKTGNFKVQCDSHLVTSASSVIRTVMYIIYIPEGVFVPSTLSTPLLRVEADYDSLSKIVQRHPEWILAWRQFGADLIGAEANLDRVTFSSRLKRNLNSGDSIYAVYLANLDFEPTSAAGPINRVLVSGMCQFWTCNN